MEVKMVNVLMASEQSALKPPIQRKAAHSEVTLGRLPNCMLSDPSSCTG